MIKEFLKKIWIELATKEIILIALALSSCILGIVSVIQLIVSDNKEEAEQLYYISVIYGLFIVACFLLLRLKHERKENKQNKELLESTLSQLNEIKYILSLEKENNNNNIIFKGEHINLQVSDLTKSSLKEELRKRPAKEIADETMKEIERILNSNVEDNLIYDKDGNPYAVVVEKEPKDEQ